MKQLRCHEEIDMDSLETIDIEDMSELFAVPYHIANKWLETHKEE